MHRSGETARPCLANRLCPGYRGNLAEVVRHDRKLRVVAVPRDARAKTMATPIAMPARLTPIAAMPAMIAPVRWLSECAFARTSVSRLTCPARPESVILFPAGKKAPATP